MPEPQPFAGQNIPAGGRRIDYPTPHPDDKLLTEFLATNAADYEAMFKGAANLKFDDFPNYRLAGEMPIDWQTVARIYARDRVEVEDTYNYNFTFDGGSFSYPVAVRDYLVRRSEYTAGTPIMGSTLTGVYRVRVTNVGSGYDPATVAVSPSGGGGTGFAATALISPDGTISAIVITNQGTGYTSAPTLAISGGTGGAATAYIQPATMVLVKEELIRQQEASTDGLYVLVRRTYMTLPGPILTEKPVQLDDGSVIVKTRQLKLASAITPGLAIVSEQHVVTEQEDSGLATFVAWEVITTIPKSAHFDETSALVTEEYRPFTFPGRVDVAEADANVFLAKWRRASTDVVSHTIKTWWVNSATKPTITIQEFHPDSLAYTGLTSVPVLHSVLHNDATLNGVPVAATSPTYTAYVALIGTSVAVDGSVTCERKHRWKVQKIFVTLR